MNISEIPQSTPSVEPDDDLDQIIATLRAGAMQYIIEQSTPGVVTILDLGDTESGLPSPDTEALVEDSITDFVRYFLKTNRVRLTQDGFNRVVRHFRKEMNTPYKGKPSIRYIDWREALKNN